MSPDKATGGLRASAYNYAGMVLVLAALVFLFGMTSKNFLRTATFISIANQAPDLTVVAVGMTLVLIVGGIDLSVGSLLALSASVLGALMVNLQWPLPAALAASCCVGGLCGLFSGMVSVIGRIPSFIVTLGMLEIARGGAYLMTNSQTVYIGSSVEWLGAPMPGVGLAPSIVIALVIVGLAHFLLTRTVFGRYCIAIGSNAEAARLSGVPTTPYRIAPFVISGVLCGLAGAMQTSRLSSADPNAAIGLELSAIAACVIGGASLMGGRGSVVNTFLGVLIIAVLQTGLAQVGVSEPAKRIITGAVIVIAVLLDSARLRWTEGKH